MGLKKNLGIVLKLGEIIDTFVVKRKYEGKIKIMKSHKYSELKWISENNLLDNKNRH